MRMRKRRVVLILLSGVLLLGIWLAKQQEPQQFPSGLVCDSSLWEHVYHPERLPVIEECKVVEGAVTSIRKEDDGDLHIRLAVEDQTLLTQKNFSDQDGELVVELICVNPPRGADALAACYGFAQDLPVPNLGDRVRVTGAYVLDKQHGWTEIHPVTHLEILP